jgi:hypothetical protein
MIVGGSTTALAVAVGTSTTALVLVAPPHSGQIAPGAGSGKRKLQTEQAVIIVIAAPLFEQTCCRTALVQSQLRVVVLCRTLSRVYLDC